MQSLAPIVRVLPERPSRNELATVLTRLPLGLSAQEAKGLVDDLDEPVQPEAVDAIWRGFEPQVDELEHSARQVLIRVANTLVNNFRPSEFAAEAEFRAVLEGDLGNQELDRFVWLADKDESGFLDWHSFVEEWCAPPNSTSSARAPSRGGLNSTGGGARAPSRTERGAAGSQPEPAKGGICACFRGSGRYEP